MIGWRVLVAIGALVALSISSARAHEGHDHDKPAPLNLPVAPRVVAVTPEFELVGVVSGRGRLTIFLHTFATNEPVKGAKMTLSSGDKSADAEAKGDGVFIVLAPWLSEQQAVDIVFALTLADGSQDLLSGRLESIAAAAPVVPAAAPTHWMIGRLRQQPELAVAAMGGLMIGVLLTLLASGAALRRRERRKLAAEAVDTVAEPAPEKEKPDGAAATIAPLRRAASATIVAVIVLLAALAPTVGGATEAVNSGLPTVPSTMATDLAQRMPDGTLFVPKATQHLLSVRTMMTKTSMASLSVELTGTVIAGPDNFGRVQPGRPGRIEAPEGGLAYVGKRIEKGQTLAFVQTYIEAADRANIDSQIAETEARINKNRTILSRYERVPGGVPQVKVDEIRGELEALIRKRAELIPAASRREAILAPISGIVSIASATIGQIVEARDVLFEIVDPAQFWVEAHGHNHEKPALQNLEAAFAIVGGNRRLSLQYVGSGLSLRHQSTVSTFKVKGEQASLAIGTPVKIVLQSSMKVDGFILPASAIVRGQTGLPIVWIKTEAERFEPQIVKFASLDGRSVVVTAGLKDELRVVVEGATLLNQVR